MSWKTSNYITLKDLGIAYRKAKADLFYQSGHPNALALCEYEKNLRTNLESLHRRLGQRSLRWMTNLDFLGGWSIIPKKLDHDVRGPEPKLKWSDPDKAWDALLRNGKTKPKAEFRLVGIHSIDFHVVSTLWMLKVGAIYDSILTKEAYGSRLRRHWGESADSDGHLNKLSTGTFKPYLEHYRRWRDRGLKIIRDSLNDGKKIVAITADVRQFYHSLSPDFLLHRDYLEAIKLTDRIGDDERRFTQALIRAIHAWAESTPLHGADPSVGIPVGLPASRLIANVALAEFDRFVSRELIPLYYGRYVDDVILVLEDTRDFNDEGEVWAFIKERIKVLKEFDPKIKESLRFEREYLGRGQIVFAGTKQKAFLLEGENGLALIEALDRQIRARASEWRSLPAVPEREEALAADLLKAIGEDGEEIDNLRNADALSMRRAAFAIRLRDIEAFEQDLSNSSWQEQRNAFIKTVTSNVLVLPRLFDFAPYLARVLGLAVACRDYAHANDFVKRMIDVVAMIRRDCKITLSGRDTLSRVEQGQVLSGWRQNLVRGFTEKLVQALLPEHKRDVSQLQLLLSNLSKLGSGAIANSQAALEKGQELFVHDLARIPFRRHYFPCPKEELWTTNSISAVPKESKRSNYIERAITLGVSSFLEVKGEKAVRLPIPLLFPTRPFSVAELYLLLPRLFTTARSKVSDLTLAFKGFRPRQRPPGISGEGPLLIPFSASRLQVPIVVTSWKTEYESWVAAVTRREDPDASRYKRLNDLMNSVIKCRVKPDYVLLPELAVPANWFPRLALRLQNCGISLIAGVEYIHHGEKEVANQVWASLITDFLGFRSTITYRQDKKRPALREEEELENKGGVRLNPLTNDQKPILSHGRFRFGILICSELTNIDFRQNLRGKVDAVFVPEWNKDIDTFSPLVESSALDIHAYIVQCNDRAFGDSRIRVPAKESWERDLIRIKGGLEDYFVVGKIDVLSLRKFQSAHRSPSKGPYKPVPDGFVIDRARKVRP